jgi:hypothetical protein
MNRENGFNFREKLGPGPKLQLTVTTVFLILDEKLIWGQI